MTEYTNFYENLREAHMRLCGTVVLYEDVPHYVLAITDHKGDGAFRMYVRPVEDVRKRYPDCIDNYPKDHASLGAMIDTWIEANPGCGILRKKMVSKHFNRFRPFPLGMVNSGTKTYFLERQPLRPKTEQGLTLSMISMTEITAGAANAANGVSPRGSGFSMWSEAFRDCVVGKFPTAADCLANLLDAEIENEAVAFSRNFAFVRGPIDMLFVAYKGDVIGVLPGGDLLTIRLGKSYKHLKEVVAELGIFTNIL